MRSHVEHEVVPVIHGSPPSLVEWRQGTTMSPHTPPFPHTTLAASKEPISKTPPITRMSSSAAAEKMRMSVLYHAKVSKAPFNPEGSKTDIISRSQMARLEHANVSTVTSNPSQRKSDIISRSQSFRESCLSPECFVQHRDGSDVVLSSEWEQCVSRSTGELYYCHIPTGETQWDLPLPGQESPSRQM